MVGDRFSSSTSCSGWLHETAPARPDPSLSCLFLKVATHPGDQVGRLSGAAGAGGASPSAVPRGRPRRPAHRITPPPRTTRHRVRAHGPQVRRGPRSRHTRRRGGPTPLNTGTRRARPRVHREAGCHPSAQANTPARHHARHERAGHRQRRRAPLRGVSGLLVSSVN